MEFVTTKISGVFIISPKSIKDSRGFFVKNFHENEFIEHDLDHEFSENFYSVSKRNVIRGMHFQTPPQDHVKIIYVPCGIITDVILDIRESSSTYGDFISVDLSEWNKKALYVPKGCAHGFLSKSDNTVVTYMQSTCHSSEHDEGIRWDSFGMEWGVKDPIISKRDKFLPKFEEYNTPFN